MHDDATPTSRPQPLPPLRTRRRAGAARRLARPALAAALLSAALLGAACGGGDGGKLPVPGTVALRNESDQTMAPLAIDEFFLQRTDGPGAAPMNLLSETLQPGAVVIIGLFPPGTYNATAVLEGGTLNVNWQDQEVVSGQPTNFTFPRPGP